MDFANISAIVSGGGGGLGGATARMLARLGTGVVLLDPDGDRASKLAADIGDRARVIVGHHLNDADVVAAIAAAQSMGTFSILINAAGFLLSTPPTVSPDGQMHDLALFREMYEMHVTGPFNMARHCAAAFLGNAPDADGTRGAIINSASTAAFDGQPGQVAYSGSKAAIVAMTLGMSRDLAAIGVRVNAIAPGPIMTPRFDQASDALKASLTENVAFPKRFGHADEYASLAEGILRTPFLNGQTIRLDGALSTPLTNMSPPKGTR